MIYYKIMSKSITKYFLNVFISESRRFLKGLKVQPNILSAEQFRGGYISAFQFYNLFHAGFCSPYIYNPNYMLIVDFRYFFGHIIYAKFQQKISTTMNYKSNFQDERRISKITHSDRCAPFSYTLGFKHNAR